MLAAVTHTQPAADCQRVSAFNCPMRGQTGRCAVQTERALGALVSQPLVARVGGASLGEEFKPVMRG